jgi:UDP-N-acetylglucosamine:LPS N-acetylglucosamine transferase
VLLVRGLPRDIGQREIIAPNIRTLNFLTTAPLAEAIRNSKTIVCRSGYSTILDLVALKRSAILIPTPGQTEQEYLGDYLMEKGWYYSQRQDKLDILNALTASQNYQLPDTFKPLGRLPIAF